METLESKNIRKKLKTMRLSWQEVQAVYQLQPDLVPDQAVLDPAEQKLRVATQKLYSEFGLSSEEDQNEAADLVAMDTTQQGLVVGHVEVAVRLQQLWEKHADMYPQQQLQGLGDFLLHTVCFFLGGSLIYMVAGMGFSLYLGWVRATFFVTHWGLVFAVAAAACSGTSAWTLAAAVSAAIVYVITTVIDKDVTARTSGVEALRGAQQDATNLRDECDAAEACPRLNAHLVAIAQSYTATLLHDEGRLEAMHNEMNDWQRQPMGTLLRLALHALPLHSTDT